MAENVTVWTARWVGAEQDELHVDSLEGVRTDKQIRIPYRFGGNRYGIVNPDDALYTEQDALLRAEGVVLRDEQHAAWLLSRAADRRVALAAYRAKRESEGWA